MIRLASKSTVSNTRLQRESCQTADYSYMTAAVMREPSSNGYQNKYWWGCEMGKGGVGVTARLEQRHKLSIYWL